ncbi:MAG: hypothetical protein Q4B42_02785 [Oscillospiraceae bacterium]|nr:hypothetical protein [Oscillospiraceae bacterium]
MEQKHIKYRLKPDSSASGVSAALLLIAAALVCVVYWPVFVKYAQAPASADARLKMMLYIYGGLAACFILAALFTGLLGKKTMLLTALFITPIGLYYTVEKLGVTQWLVFGNENGLAGVWTENAEYFSGRNLAYIAITAAFALITLSCFWSIVCNKGKSRTFAMFVIIVAAAARVLFALYDVRVNWQPLLESGAIGSADYTYAILLHIAALLFFLTMTVLAIQLRRNYIDDAAPQPIAAGAPASPAQPAQGAEASPSAPAENPAADLPEDKPAPKAEEYSADIPALEAEPVAPEELPEPAKKRGGRRKAKEVPAEEAEAAENAEATGEAKAEEPVKTAETQETAAAE